MFQIFHSNTSLFISLIKKTLTTAHTYPAAQHTTMVWQYCCLGTPGLIEDPHISHLGLPTSGTVYR